jgi:hypothetical protein
MGVITTLADRASEAELASAREGSGSPARPAAVPRLLWSMVWLSTM